MDEFFLFLLTVMGVPMGLYFIGAYLKIKLENLKQKHNLIAPKAESVQEQMTYLMAKNEEMREELRNIKYLLSRESKREQIDFDYNYEKEQMKLDYDAKGSLSL
jgi:hypothetical protein